MLFGMTLDTAVLVWTEEIPENTSDIKLVMNLMETASIQFQWQKTSLWNTGVLRQHMLQIAALANHSA